MIHKIRKSVLAVALASAGSATMAEAATKIVCADRIARAPRFVIGIDGSMATIIFERSMALDFARSLGLIPALTHDVSVRATFPATACAFSTSYPIARCIRTFDRPGTYMVQAWKDGTLLKEIPMTYVFAELTRVARTRAGAVDTTESYVELSYSVSAVEGERRAYASTKFDYGQGYECLTP